MEKLKTFIKALIKNIRFESAIIALAIFALHMSGLLGVLLFFSFHSSM